MKAFELLAYMFEHLEAGSIVGLTTAGNLPLMLSKDTDYEITVYVCNKENVKKIHITFDKPTIHRAVLKILQDISEYLGENIEELNITNEIKFEECLPKRQEKKTTPQRKKPAIDLKLLMEEMRKLPPQYDLIPLFTDNGKLIALVLENLSVISFDKVIKTVSRVSNGNISQIDIDPTTLLYVLSTLKFDLQKGNPFSSYDKYTFFTALYIDMNNIGEGEFLNRKMYKKQGKFYAVTPKGPIRPIPLEFLDLNKEVRKGLNVGYFVHDGERFIKLNSIDLLEYHEKNIFSINAYLFSSFVVTQKDFTVDYQAFDKLLSNFVNTVISKGVGARYVKDVFELENLIYDIQLVRSLSGNIITIVDPISFWYYKSRGEEVRICDSCEVKDKVNLWNRIIKNFYREFLL